MSQTTTPDGPSSHAGQPFRQDRTPPDVTVGSAPNASRQRPRGAAQVAGVLLALVGVFFLAAGAFGLWKDRVARDDQGFVTFGTTELRTGQYAIVGGLQGDGPSWIYGSAVLGDTRVRAAMRDGRPLFIGIARTNDVSAYLSGVGYATVDSFAVRADTTHPGGAPSGPASGEPIWAASTQGTGEQQLLWTPRAGDWSVVFMNTDATAGVDVSGDAGATLPALPWLAGGLLVIGGAAGVVGVWVVVRTARRSTR